MFGCPSITVKFSGACLAAMLCCTGCQTYVGGIGGTTPPSSSSMTEGFELFPTGSIFNQNQEAPIVNPYAEQQRQREFSDDQTRPSVDMTKFKPKTKTSFSLFGD